MVMTLGKRDGKITGVDKACIGPYRPYSCGAKDHYQPDWHSMILIMLLVNCMRYNMVKPRNRKNVTFCP